jgi:glutaminyl-tRNA synthetase
MTSTTTKPEKVDPLSGRKLTTTWDVNTPELEQKHLSVVGTDQVRTRFPPEPNGYLHFGHAKSMHMNFYEAFERVATYRGVETIKDKHVTFRYDDTNPEKENMEFIESQAKSVEWMGWKPTRVTFTSDYFPQMFEFAVKLIKQGKAYVCHQTGDEIEASRAISKQIAAGKTDLTGEESPWRNTSPEENLKKFYDMKRGLYEEGQASLRLKMDMRHPNPNMWDFVAYRIMYHPHPRTHDQWCIYPTYDFSHCIVDSLEDIDYSICTLEFETRRESYYWLLDALGLYRPKVFEFARLALTRTWLSKRKLKALVDNKAVRGWDDPRMPTLAGLRRRGFSSTCINQFMKEVGVTRAQTMIDFSRFARVALKELDETAPRAFGILHSVPITLENIPDTFYCTFRAPLFPSAAVTTTSIAGTDGTTTTTTTTTPTTEDRILEFSRIVYLERDNIMSLEDNPPKDFHGLIPGEVVRLRYGPLIECVEVRCDEKGIVVAAVCKAIGPIEGLPNLPPATATTKKPKGVLHWVSTPPNREPLRAEIRLYDFIFPPEGEENPNDEPMPNSEIVLKNCVVEAGVASYFSKVQEARAKGGYPKVETIQRFQFERVGYFCLDDVDCKETKLVLNRILPLTEMAITATTTTSNPSSSSSSANNGTTKSTDSNNNNNVGAGGGVSRKEIQQAQLAAKLERLQYPPHEYFKRPGEIEKWEAWDEDGVPTRAKGETEDLSKNAINKLKKEWKKHKEDWDVAQQKAGKS